VGPNAVGFVTVLRSALEFQSSVRINVGPNLKKTNGGDGQNWFQSSVRINVGPNTRSGFIYLVEGKFQSSVRINVGPNKYSGITHSRKIRVSILRED